VARDARQVDLAAVTRAVGFESIDDMLPGVDAVVLCYPLTPLTQGRSMSVACDFFGPVPSW
jgi:hypothetical protein